MDLIKPINQQQKTQVIQRTYQLIELSKSKFKLSLPDIPVHFDLSGRAMGMYRVDRGHRHIRYNPYLFAKYFQQSLKQTIPHEIAHYVTDILYGIHNIKPHGIEWQQVIQALGAEPRATGSYDLAGIPIRRQNRYAYQCDCMQHQLTTIRHNRVLQGKASYRCQKCGTALVCSTPEPAC